ncbi:hypothetical protein MAR_006942 [Mya arenaria]|uniref:Uncharacterized protein n=1 Tax=Mya arenaria TaxID=6604 RepID=A0ABY7D9Y1_MYAAR|nr:hypothetical protein MAR_006942 [Mya arenaria]
MESIVEDLQPLMEEDNSDCEEHFNHALDDYSSGYDSADVDVSDVDSDECMMSQNASCPSKHKPMCPNVGHQVRARVSSMKTLCESLKLILNMPEMCDVTFLVGTDNTPVHGPSSFGVRLTIPVHKYEAEVFRMLIQFIHCGAATITDLTVTGLLCGACQFELGDLEVACWRYLRARLSSGHEETILDGSRKEMELNVPARLPSLTHQSTRDVSAVMFFT